MAEILIRMETSDGMKGYALEANAAADLASENYKTLITFAPGPIKAIIEGAMFALRHGVIQKMLRDAGLPEMCKGCPDKDLEAVRGIVRIVFKGMHDEQLKELKPGESVPIVDIMKNDMMGAAAGVFIRRPDLDCDVAKLTGETPSNPQIVEAVANEAPTDWYSTENQRIVDSIASSATTTV